MKTNNSILRLLSSGKFENQGASQAASDNRIRRNPRSRSRAAMGVKLTSIYSAIKQDGGMRAQMRLAMMMGMPSQMAANVPDTPEELERFSRAYRDITAKECPVSMQKGGTNV
ncbi:hypothetical protein LQZ19_18435 [Treponema primitia]|uniref:hypothetical protein n=1 Tax=Treponema primitia TaxID=88058 RepID=UPI0039809DFD